MAENASPCQCRAKLSLFQSQGMILWTAAPISVNLTTKPPHSEPVGRQAGIHIENNDLARQIGTASR
jgi:hypothetical protein